MLSQNLMVVTQRLSTASLKSNQAHSAPIQWMCPDNDVGRLRCATEGNSTSRCDTEAASINFPGEYADRNRCLWCRIPRHKMQDRLQHLPATSASHEKRNVAVSLGQGQACAVGGGLGGSGQYQHHYDCQITHRSIEREGGGGAFLGSRYRII